MTVEGTAFNYDLLPFCASQFTGKERDSETGLDYFGARYYGSNLSRFLSIDPVSVIRPPAAVTNEPQRWNAYSYALNNPLRNIDHDGRFSEPVHTWITTQAAQGRGYSAGATASLNRWNAYVDRKSNFFANKEHGILDSKRTSTEGYAATAHILTERLNSAVESALKGDYAAALSSLGQGTHTAQDLQAHGMKLLIEHPLGESSLNNDGTKVSGALTDTQDFLSIFESNVIQAAGEEAGQQILNELKNFTPQDEQQQQPKEEQQKPTERPCISQSNC